MSTHAATTSSANTAPAASRALVIGVAGLAVTLLGVFVSGDTHALALSYLVGITFWTAIAIGMLMWVMIHHIFDASWSVILRRQFEHGITAFFPLAVLFAPLVIVSLVHPGSIWPWMDLSHPLHGGHGTVGEDVLYLKKSGFLNSGMFTGMTIAFFVIFIWLSARLRKASFSQDADGDLKWTTMNRKTAAYVTIGG